MLSNINIVIILPLISLYLTQTERQFNIDKTSSLEHVLLDRLDSFAYIIRFFCADELEDIKRFRKVESQKVHKINFLLKYLKSGEP